MNNIKFNVIYSNEDIFLENIIDTIVKEKKGSLIMNIKNNNILQYNKKIDYLSTKKEVDKN
ncbi:MULTISPECIES: hypothetical protein [Clostridium]|uniref:hypothetical protein n=1 Tax=Clostridium TaxID=1485 RepID=UPI002913B4F4|nr:hypothetical protein [Clostridium sp.]MDU6521371.1 hypothetical protein [Clostridium sp.]